jgi:hypothetical protein
MIERSQWGIAIGIATLILLILLLIVVLLQRRRLDKISDQLAEGATDNGETLKGKVEFENDATRRHLSGAVDAIRNDTKTTKLGMYELTDRQSIDTKELHTRLDGLKALLQWLVKRGPPQP